LQAGGKCLVCARTDHPGRDCRSRRFRGSSR
jgi:hypothetical protein